MSQTRQYIAQIRLGIWSIFLKSGQRTVTRLFVNNLVQKLALLSLSKKTDY
jgi:hypothetical protein